MLWYSMGFSKSAGIISIFLCKEIKDQLNGRGRRSFDASADHHKYLFFISNDQRIDKARAKLTRASENPLGTTD